MDTGLIVALVMFLLGVGLPLRVALASARNWIPERFWNPEAVMRETWLERHWWVASLLMAVLVVAVSSWSYREGRLNIVNP